MRYWLGDDDDDDDDVDNDAKFKTFITPGFGQRYSLITHLIDLICAKQSVRQNSAI